MSSVSLYIHIPFCAKKCDYCDFLSFDNEFDRVSAYVETLIKELEAYREELINQEVSTIFIGGGTPSVVDGKYIQEIMACIFRNFQVREDAEITIECNPGTLNKEKALIYKNAGINRISMGLQSTNNDCLRKLGRIHSYDVFLQNYKMLRQVGFENVNIDLMFGLHNQSLLEWEETLYRVIELKPEHISVYGLIIEEGTVYKKKYDQDQLELPTEELERTMYWKANKILRDCGYVHYEISNYALEGKECRHNCVYWTLKPYIGIGLGASSFYGGYRYSNIIDLKEYINSMGDLEKIVAEKSEVTPQMLQEEYMFLGLRLIEGVSPSDFHKVMGLSLEESYGHIVNRFVDDGLLKYSKGRLRLTKRGLDVSNQVFAEFLL